MKLVKKTLEQLYMKKETKKKLKEKNRMMKSQRSDRKRDKLKKDGIKMGIDEIVKQNERINNL